MSQAAKTRIISLFLAFVTVFCTVFVAVQTPLIARAETTYSEVLDDLRKDDSFQTSNYPERTGDYSLQIIQIAESVNRELFVYVYQPSGSQKDLRACSINISTTINDAISFINYKLDYLNSSGVFYKYKVRDFTVLDENVRYYAITSIYRPFDASIDAGTGNNTTITEVNYDVSRQYTFGTINGNPYVNCIDIETIVVTDKFVGFVRYPDGFKLYYGACDSHFVAFNTDKRIDRLLEADVYYTTQAYSMVWATFVGKKEEFGEKSDNYAYLKYTDKVEHNGGGLFAGTYTWDRIQSVEEFIANENRDNVYHGAILDVTYSTQLTDEALQELQGKHWVLRFAETEYSLWSGDSSYGKIATMVGDVTILRLKFETDGIVYNLGVIDNKQTGSNQPSNVTKVSVSLNDKGKRIVWLILLILLLVLLAPVLPYVISFVIWIICLPFKLIGAIIKFGKRRRQEKEERRIYERVIASIDESEWDDYEQ